MSVQRINFTKRSRLTRDEANVTVHPDGNGGPATFETRLNLTKLRDKSGEARVFVEAYHQTTRMRFEYGTVAAIAEPPLEERRLYEFSDWRDVRFRVKVTDVVGEPGKLMAWADRIKPQGPDDREEPDLVHFKDAQLFGRLWDLEFHDEMGPVVLIEKAYGVQQVGRDARFQAAVFPEILRRTLERAFLVDAIPYPTPGHWSTAWVDGYLKPKLGLGGPPDDEQAAREWIQLAVETFARRHRIADLWGQVQQENG